jgi:hypothetical protein
MGRIQDEFRVGQESAKITSHGDAVLRAFLTVGAIAVAWLSPVPIWGKVSVFFGAMFIIGIIVQVLKGSRNE